MYSLSKEGEEMIWKDIKTYDQPDVETWVLVRNSAGFYAAVNEVTVNIRSEEYRGWAITPEEETLVISDIIEWTEIT